MDNNCLKCNTSLKNTNLKRYCRPCIGLIKDARLDKDEEDKCKCTNCRCFKPLDSFITKQKLVTCVDCRTRKNNKTPKEKENNKQQEEQEREDSEPEEIKTLHNQKYKTQYTHKLKNILQYLKNKYNILETLEELEKIDNTEKEEEPDDTTEQEQEDARRREDNKDEPSDTIKELPNYILTLTKHELINKCSITNGPEDRRIIYKETLHSRTKKELEIMLLQQQKQRLNTISKLYKAYCRKQKTNKQLPTQETFIKEQHINIDSTEVTLFNYSHGCEHQVLYSTPYELNMFFLINTCLICNTSKTKEDIQKDKLEQQLYLKQGKI